MNRNVSVTALATRARLLILCGSALLGATVWGADLSVVVGFQRLALQAGTHEITLPFTPFPVGDAPASAEPQWPTLAEVFGEQWKVELTFPLEGDAFPIQAGQRYAVTAPEDSELWLSGTTTNAAATSGAQVRLRWSEDGRAVVRFLGEAGAEYVIAAAASPTQQVWQTVARIRTAAGWTEWADPASADLAECYDRVSRLPNLAPWEPTAPPPPPTSPVTPQAAPVTDTDAPDELTTPAVERLRELAELGALVGGGAATLSALSNRLATTFLSVEDLIQIGLREHHAYRCDIARIFYAAVTGPKAREATADQLGTAYNLTGECDWLEGKTLAALAHFELADAALEGRPWRTWTKLALANCLNKLGRYAEARQRIAEMQELEPPEWVRDSFVGFGQWLVAERTLRNLVDFGPARWREGAEQGLRNVASERSRAAAAARSAVARNEAVSIGETVVVARCGKGLDCQPTNAVSSNVYTTAGIYILSTDLCGSFGMDAQTTVKVTAVAAVLPASATICVGSNISLTALATPGPDFPSGPQWVLEPTNAGTLNTSGTNAIFHAAGDFTGGVARVWAVCGASSNNATVTVTTNFWSGWTVSQAPAISVTVSGEVAACASTTVTFTAHVSPTPGMRYRSDVNGCATTNNVSELALTNLVTTWTVTGSNPTSGSGTQATFAVSQPGTNMITFTTSGETLDPTGSYTTNAVATNVSYVVTLTPIITNHCGARNRAALLPDSQSPRNVGRARRSGGKYR